MRLTSVLDEGYDEKFRAMSRSSGLLLGWLRAQGSLSSYIHHHGQLYEVCSDQITDYLRSLVLSPRISLTAHHLATSELQIAGMQVASIRRPVKYEFGLK